MAEENPLDGSAPKHYGVIGLLFSSASLSVIASALIIYTLADGTIDFFRSEEASIFEFITSTKWVPNGLNPSFGIWPLLSGTALIAGGSLLLAIPIGVSSALYLSEFCSNRTRKILKPLIEVLSGIPSVVHGFFALLVISPIIREYFDATYFNAASAIIVVAAMILPIIVSISDDAIRAVPREMREASLALGATRWETASRVILPSARSGIVASVLLALARAVGETMAVTLAAGSVASLHLNPMKETQTLTAYIAQVATGDIPPGPATDAGFAVGSTLFIMTYVANLFAIRATKKKFGNSKNYSVGYLISKLMLKFRYFRNIESNISISSNLIEPLSPNRYDLKRRSREKYSVFLIGSSFSLGIIFLLVLLQTVIESGINGISYNFLTNFPSSRSIRAGIGPVILGSVYLISLAILFALPSGVGAAIYLNEIQCPLPIPRRSIS